MTKITEPDLNDPALISPIGFNSEIPKKFIS